MPIETSDAMQNMNDRLETRVMIRLINWFTLFNIIIVWSFCSITLMLGLTGINLWFIFAISFVLALVASVAVIIFKPISLT